MKREIFSAEHDLFRSEFKRFALAEIEPRVEGWNAAGISDRATWLRMGEMGYLGANMPEAYGGGGGDFLYDMIIVEELSMIRAHALQTSLHTDICMPYLLNYGSEEQKQRFLTRAIVGECLLAIAMVSVGVAILSAAKEPQAVKNNRVTKVES